MQIAATRTAESVISVYFLQSLPWLKQSLEKHAESFRQSDIHTYIHTYIHNLYLNTMIIKAVSLWGRVFTSKLT